MSSHDVLTKIRAQKSQFAASLPKSMGGSQGAMQQMPTKIIARW